MGLGVLGRGVGDAAFLASCGAHVLATDLRSAEELSSSVEKLKPYPNISFYFGGHREKDFTECDMVVKAAGVPIDSPYIQAARNAGVPIAMSTALFAKYAAEEGVIVVGVTGTRGKSTVTNMIAHALKATGKRVHLGGNIRGLSTLALLSSVRPGDVAVLELDSWQLQGFADLAISPHIAVFTNLMPDHLNYYPTMDAYFEDKANIFRFQKRTDTLVVGPSIANRAYAACADWGVPVTPMVPGELPSEWKLHIPGRHNRENAALARAALRALEIPDETIHDALATFGGIEGRLQFVRTVGGVEIYNDNNATTPEATIAALQALDLGKKRIVLIAGGADKKLDMADLVKEINRSCKAVVLLAGTGTERITNALPDAQVCDDLQSAVHAALRNAEPGDAVLFSPAFASFGMFKNEYDRNDQFLALIRSLA